MCESERGYIMAKKKEMKSRSFAFILYPESLPEGWIEKIETLKIPMAISPIHDKDERENVNALDLGADDMKILDSGGKLYKKEHYHVLYCAPNPVTASSVRNKINRKLDGLSLVSHIEIVDSVEHYFLYLTHESSDAKKKKKRVYDKKDIRFLSNFDIDRYITLDEHQKKELLNAILREIRSYHLENIFDLADHIDSKGDELGISDMNVVNDVIKSHSGILRLYFDGAYQMRQRGKVIPSNVDKETGEIIENNKNKDE